MGLTSLLFTDETTTSSSDKSENTNNEKLNGGLISLISLLNQLTSILKHPKTPPSTRQSIFSFVSRLIYEETNIGTPPSSQSESPSTSNSKSIPSHTFYSYILAIIEFAETIKKDRSYGFDVVEKANALTSLATSFYTKDYISKYSTYKEESMKFLTNNFLFNFFCSNL
jgi:hypothetical protein